MKPTRMHLCPDCSHIVFKVIMYGQLSYECPECRRWGAWKFRKTIRHPDRPKRKVPNKMPVHTMDHPTIPFSSTNPKQTAHYATVLKDVTLDQLKGNQIVGRHVLLRDMMFAGYAPISGIYFGILEKKQHKFNEILEQYKGTSQFTLRSEECRLAANDYILQQYGWTL